MKILVIGDIYGKAGRHAAAKAIKKLKKEHNFDLVIANGENMAHGKGMTIKTFAEMRTAGVDFFTTGNHIFSKEAIFEEMNKKDTIIIRPDNFPGKNPGKSHQVLNVNGKNVLIINIMGQVFMNDPYDNPFLAIDKILKQYEKEKFEAILVDFHAEATSEKIAMKHYLDGRVTAMWGTHTHIPTADCAITKKGMAYITDVGMTGPDDSVIGVKTENIIESFLQGTKFKLEPAEGACTFNAVIIELSGFKASGIELIQLPIV